MKKTNVLLVFLAVLLLVLCGCQSSKENEPKDSSSSYQSSNDTQSESDTASDTPKAENSNESDSYNEYEIYITPGEPYEQGVLTTTEYYSEWLDLYWDIPFNLRLSEEDIDNLETVNQIYSTKYGQVQELMAVDSDNTMGINIYVSSIDDNKTLKQYVDNHYKDIRDAYEQHSVNGVSIIDTGDDFSTYSFLGEKYLLNARKIETRFNGELSRASYNWGTAPRKTDTEN